MWPFRRRPTPVESVRLGELTHEPSDYTTLTVGQSRLGKSFQALGIGAETAARCEWATLRPVVDQRMNAIADITVIVDGHVVGYLRPPALDMAIALLSEHNTRTLEVPVRLAWGPAGPDAMVRL
jgi:hypothetical protein